MRVCLLPPHIPLLSTVWLLTAQGTSWGGVWGMCKVKGTKDA